MSKTPSKSRIEINDARKEVFLNGREIALPPSEYKVLYALKETNRALTREEIGAYLGHTKEEAQMAAVGRCIDQYVARLRRKLKADAKAVQTVHGHGYKLASAYA